MAVEQVAIQQEVEEALCLRREVLGFALLLVDGQQLCLRAQHLVFRDFAVVEQRFVDAQVLAQQRLAGRDDLDGAARLQPVEVADRHVAPQGASDRHAIEAGRIEQRTLRADRCGNRRRIQRLAHDYARVLLFAAQERHDDIVGRAETRLPALRDQQLVERRVDRIQRRADRDRELASAVRLASSGPAAKPRERSGRARPPAPGLPCPLPVSRPAARDCCADASAT